MSVPAGWLLAPLVLMLLCTGVGLLVERAWGRRMPGTLLPAAGLAGTIVLAGPLVLLDATAELATPAVALAALAGFGLATPWRDERLRAAWPWPLLVATGAFALFAAPSVLTGQASIAGYVRLDDSATWLALTDRLMTHGRDLSGLAPSTYRRTLEAWLHSGYPVGSLLPLGIVSKLTAQDPAGTYQPTIAVYASILALGLYACARALAGSRALAAAAALVADHADRAPDDPAIDRGHEVEALGDGQEGGGGDELAAGAVHPQQQLVLRDLAAGEVDDRLRVEDEAVLGERVADHVGPRHPRLETLLLVLRRRVGGEPVAAALLGVVHREVGVDEHLLAREAVAGVEARHAEARGHRARPPGGGRDGERAHGVEHRGGDRVGLLRRGLRQQDRELVAAQPGEHVGLAQAAAQRVRHPHDQFVAGRVAERVVDRLEVVQVEHDRRALGPVALDVGDVALELALEGAAVEEPGQRVVIGHVAQLGLVATPLGDVLHL